MSKIDVYFNGSNIPGKSKIVLGSMTLLGPISLSLSATDSNQIVPKSQVDALASNFTPSELNQTVPMNASGLPGYTGDFSNAPGSSVFTMNNSGVTPGTYPKVSVNARGIIVDGGPLTPGDLPNIDWSKIDPSTLPTTLDGYGIEDAASSTATGTNKNIIMSGPPATSTEVATYNYAISVLGNIPEEQIAPGSIIATYRNEAVRTSALRANGALVSKASFPALYTAIGDTYNNRRLPNHLGNPSQHQFDVNYGSDSTIGPFDTQVITVNGSTAPYPAGMVGDSFVTVFNNKVYWLRPRNSGTDMHSNVVSVASIDSNGVVGNFVDSASTIPFGMYMDYSVAQMFLFNGSLYVAGRSTTDGTNTYDSMFYSVIDPSTGDLGVWQTVYHAAADATPTSRPSYESVIFPIGGKIFKLIFDYTEGDETGIFRTYILNGTNWSLYQGTTTVTKDFFVRPNGTMDKDANGLYIKKCWPLFTKGNIIYIYSKLGQTGLINDRILGIEIKDNIEPLNSTVPKFNLRPVPWGMGDMRSVSSTRPTIVQTNSRYFSFCNYNTDRSKVFTLGSNSDVSSPQTEIIPGLPYAPGTVAAFVTSSRLYLVPGKQSDPTKAKTLIYCSLTGGNNTYQQELSNLYPVDDVPDDKFRLPDLTPASHIDNGELTYFIKI